MSGGIVALSWRGRRVGIEHAWIAPERRDAPLLVFLHEGLGSLAMWKDFPRALCDACGARGLVWSRPGYGRSDAAEPGETWQPDYMHRQAFEVLPALFEALGIDPVADPPWLVGHSDGGSIALLYAGRFPACVGGLVLLAPHILVEDRSVAGIEQARIAYAETDLRDRLAKYHRDPDLVFRRWNDVWLSPAFRAWSIADEIAPIACPVLAVQGVDDAYGTLEQIRGIARRLPQTDLLELPDCGHSAHRDQRDRVLDAVAGFVRRHRPR